MNQAYNPADTVSTRRFLNHSLLLEVVDAYLVRARLPTVRVGLVMELHRVVAIRAVFLIFRA